MTRALFFGCWAGVALLVVHLVVARLRFGHWPSFLRIGSTFGTVVGFVTAVYPLWPILSDPEPGPIQNPSEIMLSLWMGFVAAFGIAALAIKDNWEEMVRRCPPTSTPPSAQPPEPTGGPAGVPTLSDGRSAVGGE